MRMFRAVSMFVVMVMLAMAVRMHVPMFVCVAMLMIVFMRVVQALAAAADAAHYSTSNSLIRIWSPPTICS